jgi:hypothetical protein
VASCLLVVAVVVGRAGPALSGMPGSVAALLPRRVPNLSLAPFLLWLGTKRPRLPVSCLTVELRGAAGGGPLATAAVMC